MNDNLNNNPESKVDELISNSSLMELLEAEKALLQKKPFSDEISPADVVGIFGGVPGEEMSESNKEKGNPRVHSNIPGGSHSSYPFNNGGFASKFVMALMIAFACGAAASALYIFMSLGSVVVSL